MKEIAYGIIPLKKIEKCWHLLFVQHLQGHWAFPKGHPEGEETLLETAQRELSEETALTVTRLLREEPFVEEYRFLREGNMISKKVAYFLAEVEGEEKVQLKEIIHFQWVVLEKAEQRATFLECRRLCREVIEFLKFV